MPLRRSWCHGTCDVYDAYDGIAVRTRVGSATSRTMFTTLSTTPKTALRMRRRVLLPRR